MHSEIMIREARTAQELEALRIAFLDHADRTGMDPSFAGLREELADLPGLYAAPRGALLLSFAAEGRVLGAAAMRPLPGPGDCNLTGVIVASEARGQGLGGRLAAGLIQRARAAGHLRMHLDTAEDDAAALALWQGLGFVPAPPYFPNPRPGMQHMVLDLAQAA